MAADLDDLKTLIGRSITEVEYESGGTSAYLIDSKGYGHEIEVNPVETDEEE